MSAAGGLLLLGFLSAVPPSKAAPPQTAPDIACDEQEFFFGSVSNTETVEHEFIISNEGTAPLHISGVKTDCGCLAARPENNTLAPGESTPLQIKFSLRGRSGPQFRRIIVKSNDPDQPHLILTMTGETIAPLEVIPEQIFWGNIHYTAVAERSCEIRFSEGEQSYITSVETPANVFTAELITVTPRRHYKIKIRTVPPMRPGSLQTSLRVTSDHPRLPTIEIPMQARIIGDIFSIPEELVLAPSNDRSRDRVFLVYSGLKKKFRITKVELPQPEMKAYIRPMALAQGYRIHLRNIIPSDSLNGSNIVVITDCETMPALAVPLRIEDNNKP